MSVKSHRLLAALGGGDKRKLAVVKDFSLENGDFVLFTGDSNVKAEYEHWGIPEGSGIIPPFISTSTPSDMCLLNKVLKAHPFDIAIIYDSDYHILRSQMLAHRILKEKFNLGWIAVADPISFFRRIGEWFALIREFFTVWKCTGP